MNDIIELTLFELSVFKLNTTVKFTFINNKHKELRNLKNSVLYSSRLLAMEDLPNLNLIR